MAEEIPDARAEHEKAVLNQAAGQAAYGVHTRFTAQTGDADTLTEMLLAAARALESNADCLLYVVSRAPDDPDTIYVTEAWSSQEAHDASLQREEVQATIRQARPLIAGITGTEMRPVGGKGLSISPPSSS
ncbi:MAG TPA: putative quinol monooxygenase [Chloroflexota bacterium]|nr:putative quinol monooxygenase [Chloroflexota bacterium]